MTFSIIIPVYNVAPYLEACVQSVQRQLYTQWEGLLVDDGSTDGSGALCDQIARQDARWKVIHQPNGGLSAARNSGIKAATGDYLAFLDGDDIYLLADGLFLLAERLKASMPDILLFQCVDVYAHQQTVRPPYSEALFEQPPLQVFATLVQSQTFQMSACFQVIRRQYLLQHNLWFQTGLLSEDVEWSLRLWAKPERVGAFNLPLYGYQHRNNSITTTYSLRNLRSYAAIFEQYITLYPNASSGYPRFAMGYLAQMYVSCMYAYYQIQKCDRKEAKHILNQYNSLLQYSCAPKSNRVVKVQKVIGRRLTLWLFATYGALKRKYKK